MKGNLDLLCARLALIYFFTCYISIGRGWPNEIQKKTNKLRTLPMLEGIGRTFTVDEWEHVICLKYAEKVDKTLAHTQAAALKSMVRTLFAIWIICSIICIYIMF